MVFGLISELIGIHWILINTIIVLFVYQFIIKTWSFFDKQNVKFIRGFPVIGTQFRSMFGLEGVGDSLERAYYRYPNEKIVGLYNFFGYPSYMIRDPELVKQITIKDFEHYPNHSVRVNEDSDPIMGKTMFILRDQRWKDMRGTLSPAFTGNKMRLMFSLMDNVSKNFVKYMQKKTENGPITLEMREIMQKVANDVIASCAFGVEVDSLVNPDNEFFKSGQVLSNFEGAAGLRFVAYMAIPKIMNAFKVKIFKKQFTDYFVKIVKNNIEYREKHNVVRHDMIDLLMEAQKGTLKGSNDVVAGDTGFATVDDSHMVKNTAKVQKWTDADLVAQCLIFFIAGFDSVSTTLGYAIHEITVNPDIQEKLVDEITAVQQKLNGKPINYEEIQKMKYLDMVISETLRRWAIAIANDRIVEKPATIENTDGSIVQLNVGDSVWLPVYTIHTDARYFPNPKKFDPERFSDERKHEIISGTYFPFGIGPRSCIASRFALLECKLVLFKLLSNFHLEKSDQTQDPLQLKKTIGGLYPEKGFHVQLRARK